MSEPERPLERVERRDAIQKAFRKAMGRTVLEEAICDAALELIARGVIKDVAPGGLTISVVQIADAVEALFPHGIEVGR